MKTLKLIAVGIILLVSSTSKAQVSVSINIGTAPAWAPSGNVNVGYYYLPEIQSYYDVRAQQFICLDRGNWVYYRNLPPHYRHYNLYKGRKVVLNNYHGNRPYANFDNDRARYNRGNNGHYHYNEPKRHHKKEAKGMKNKYASNNRDSHNRNNNNYNERGRR